MNYATYALPSEYGTPQWTSRLVSIPFNSPTSIMLANHVYWNLGVSVNTAAQSTPNDTLYMPYTSR